MNIVVLSPIQVEHDAILAHLPRFYEETAGGSRYLSGAFTGQHQSYKIITQLTGSKNETIALAAERAIQHFKPVVILLAGVAGGVKDVSVGDVVVGTKYYGYEFGKETPEGFVTRPESGYYSKELVTLAQSVAGNKDWLRRIKTGLPVQPKVVFGPIASGNKVIAATDSNAFRLLKKSYNDTIALEMEAIGLGMAMQSFPSVRFLNVRGISDLLDGKSKSDAAGSQELAAAHMAAFVFELINRLDVSLFNQIGMDIRTLAEEVVKAIVQGYKSNSLGGSTADLLTAVSPLLGSELELLKNTPDYVDAQADVRSELRRVLEGKKDLQNTLAEKIERIKRENSGATVMIAHSKNVIHGSKIKVAGDFHLGDK